MRFYFVFFKILPTWALDIFLTIPISTALSARRDRLHFACPSGAVVHAKAVILALCLPSNFVGGPDLGR